MEFYLLIKFFLINFFCDILMKKTASNAGYFAVFVPQKSGDDSEGGVFGNFNEALTIVKKFKQHGARFKCFNDPARADIYSKTGGESILENKGDISPNNGRRTPPYALRSLKKLGVETSTAVEEKPIPYEAPSRSQLAQFRKAIEQFDDDQIEELILQNPRYLVNCNSDSPTIIFEGCRYNALHVAAKCGNLFVCDLILKLLGADDFARQSSDSQYLRLLYPEDDEESLERRRKFLLDMFLNTPDKALHETPLHFAAKNSKWDVMRLLYSLPICDKLAKNKYGETAVALAKARASDDDNALFLADNDCQLAKASYVGLYRSDDCSVLPFVKPPCIGFPPIVLDDETVDLSEEYTKLRRKRLENTEKSMRLSAYAGPMSHETANQFYIDWSSKRIRYTDTQETNLSKISRIDLSKSPAYAAKRSDLRKGAETLGRELSLHYETAWLEFWPFLNKFCNLSSEDGLRSLEDHLLDQKFKFKRNDRVDADQIAAKLLALPSPFFDHAPRTPRKKTRTVLNFNNEPVPAIDNAAKEDTFYDCLDRIVDVSNFETNIDLNTSSGDDLFETPPETPPCVFINGGSPSRDDLDALSALKALNIDPEKFPLVYKWKNRMIVQTISPKRRL